MKKGWEVKTLGEICELYQPKTISTKEMAPTGKYPVFGANGIIGRYDKFNHEEPQLLITCRGATCGSVNISESKSWITGNAMVVRPIADSVNVRFLEYFFRGGIDISKVISGAAQPQITRQALSPVLVQYPKSISEQHRIVTILDEAFAAIAKAKVNAEKNVANAREVFDIYMNNFFTNHDKKWKETTIGDVCGKVEYGTSSKSKEKGKIPVLRMGNIQNRRFVWDSLVYTDDEAEINKYLLKNNDVLFNRTNSPELVGKSAIYKGEMPSIFAGYLIRLHRKENLIDADYLNYYLSSDKAINFGKTVVISSVNQANINGTKLKTYPIPIPPLLEQQSFVTRLDNLAIETQRLEAIYQKKLANLDELKKSILEKAFSGEL
ncbi:MAG: restriction endonuclease subunit S [Bacteroidetes bacterium]|nr:restriction endonuclease subunit S [Bacteroidota bacterium]